VTSPCRPHTSTVVKSIAEMVAQWAPRNVLHDEFLDLLHHSRPARSAPFLALIPFGCDELPMPGQDRVRGDDTGEVEERLSADRLSCDRQPATLFVGEPDSSVAQLLEEDAVLLSQIVDRRLLVAVDPAGHRQEQDLPWLEGVGHG